MRKLMLAGTAASAAAALWVGFCWGCGAARKCKLSGCSSVPSGAVRPRHGSLFLMHLLQQEAGSAGVPMGSPRSCLRTNQGRLRILNSPHSRRRRLVRRRAASTCPEVVAMTALGVALLRQGRRTVVSPH